MNFAHRLRVSCGYQNTQMLYALGLYTICVYYQMSVILYMNQIFS